MKKTISILLILAMMLGLAGCSLKQEDYEEDPEPIYRKIRIGVFESQSGENGMAGKQETLGIQFANKQTPYVEIGGETFEIDLIYADNASAVELAPLAAQNLISNSVSVVLGSYGSDVCIAAGPDFSKAGMPVIGMSCTNPQVTENCDVYFRICFLDQYQGVVQADFARKELGAKKAYCLVRQDGQYSTDLTEYFAETFGPENCVIESYAADCDDFTSYLEAAKAQSCDVLFAPTYPESGAILIKNAVGSGFDLPILAGDTWDSNIILKAASGTDLEIYLSSFYQEGANEAFDKALKKWIRSDSAARSNNGGSTDISAVSAMGYDAYHIALEAMKAAGSFEKDAILKALPGVSYEGVTGNISFDSIGDAKRDSAFIKKYNTQDGSWELVGKVDFSM